ncbi:MAG: RagB/SusD family nutrient uptake outer membrane protein [Duncaniella sp.]|nr:RagB/SusD family nutrient uptake outer membrane protein [Duncaniella sp.]
MNKYIATLSRLLMGGGLLLMSGCTDYLDKAPGSDIDENEPYKNFRNFQGFVEELYSAVPKAIANDYHCSWNLGEDEYWEPTDTRPMARYVDNGNYRPFVDGGEFIYGFPRLDDGDPASQERFKKGNLWKLSWYSIRKANIGLANLDRLGNATAEERDLIKGQLLFFRGWCHFNLMMYWGGLPYIDSALPSGGSLSMSRLSFQECADHAAADLEAAAELLPVDWDKTDAGKTTLGNNNERANKIMALAFAGKVMLYAGSPLMNYESQGVRSYNADYCQKAAEYFGQALKLVDETGRYELAPFSQYTELFHYADRGTRVPGLKESILMENLCELLGGSNWNQKNDYHYQKIVSSGVKVQPTANYVLYFGMANGLPIPSWTEADPVSGYDPSYPWKNRDPRFYKIFGYDGSQIVKDDAGTLDKEVKYASLYSKGDMRTHGGGKANQTGFVELKWVPLIAKQCGTYNEYEICMALSFMRLADVYLMYAESAANGYGAPTSKAKCYGMTAVEAVNKIRERAGVPGVDARFLGSNDSFMSELRRERAVELAFEGHRFHDLRRWLLLTERPYTLKTRLEFARAPGIDYDRPADNRVTNLREEVILERQLEERHYWFPLPTADVNIYPEFRQNPGW